MANKDPQDSPALFSDHLWLCVKQLSPNTEEEVRPSRFVAGAQVLFIYFLFSGSLFQPALWSPGWRTHPDLCVPTVVHTQLSKWALQRQLLRLEKAEFQLCLREDLRRQSSILSKRNFETDYFPLHCKDKVTTYVLLIIVKMPKTSRCFFFFHKPECDYSN